MSRAGSRGIRMLIVTMAASLTALVTAAPAVAVPPDTGSAATSDAAGPRVDNSRWPADLNWVIPGTTEFTEKYLSGRTVGGVTALTGCGKSEGGDAWAYTRDFFTDLGTILDAQATSTGQPVMALGDTKIPTAPWPGLANDRGIQVGVDQAGTPEFATPGILLPMPDSGGALANGVGVCAKTLAKFGTPSTSAPFGFGFYQAPDQGSVDFLMTQLAAQPIPPGAGGIQMVSSTRYYQRGHGGGVDGWEFSPLDVTGYCTDQNNPFCLTAAFLRCPAGNGQSDEEAAAITACRTWNANVIILNQQVAMTLLTPGVGVDEDGSLDPTEAVANPTGQAPLDAWTGVAAAGRTLTSAVKMFYVTLGAAVLIGGLVAGGLVGLLAAAGVIGAAAVISSQGLFGAAACATDLPKCLAAAGSDGLLKSLSLIPDAAASAQVPDMTGQSWRDLLGVLGGISAALVLLFFLISLLAALITHRPAAIWPAFFGLISWGAAMGLGGVFLTMLVRARDGTITMLTGSSDGRSVLEGFTTSVTDSVAAIAADPSPGLLLAGLLCIVGMVLAVVVWLVCWAASQWVPLVVALLVLQTAGLAAPGMPRRWLSRGFSALWTLLLTPPMVILIWRVGMLGLESNTGYLGLMIGVLVLAGCSFAFLVVPRMLPMGEGGGLGLGAALLSAASWVAGRASTAGRRNRSRQEMNDQHLDAAGGSGASGGGGTDGDPTDPTGPAGAGRPHSSSPSRIDPPADGSGASGEGISDGPGRGSGDSSPTDSPGGPPSTPSPGRTHRRTDPDHSSDGRRRHDSDDDRDPDDGWQWWQPADPDLVGAQ